MNKRLEQSNRKYYSLITFFGTSAIVLAYRQYQQGNENQAYIEKQEVKPHQGHWITLQHCLFVKAIFLKSELL